MPGASTSRARASTPSRPASTIPAPLAFKIARLFAVTHRPDFFSRYGFTPGPRQAVPEKVMRDCVGCPKERKCTLVATVATVLPERELLHVLNGSVKELSVA